MKQEEKDLLLKDLCARLPYGVKFAYNKNIYTAKGIDLIVTDEGDWEYAVTAKGIEPIEIDFIKPYLFPISSMTKTQQDQLCKTFNNLGSYVLDKDLNITLIISRTFNLPNFQSAFDFLDKNHFDYRGLIEKGLAIDATNLGIYK